MKTLEQILQQEPVFLADWEDSKQEDIFTAFIDTWRGDEATTKRILKQHRYDNILFAYYSYEDYSGEAYVLFEQKGKLYEVHGGHCSCYGLENQWEPEEVTLEQVKTLLEKSEGSRWPHAWNKQLKKFLGV